MRIEAKVHAADAPPIERGFVFALAGALAFLGLIGTDAYAWAPLLLVAGTTIWLASPFLLQRRRPYRASIDPGAGSVTIYGKNRLFRRIHTRKLAGASVATTNAGAVVTLSERGSAQPIAIEVTSVDDANAIRSALGIPHTGFGELTWSTEPRASEAMLLFVRAFSVLAWLAYGIALVGHSLTASSTFLVPALVATALAVLLALLRVFVRERTIRMNQRCLDATDVVEYEQPPWSDVEELTHDDRTITVTRTQPGRKFVIPCVPTAWLPTGLRKEERALMIAQLEGAVAVAKGSFAPFVDPAIHLDSLRKNDLQAVEWLTKLDALASVHESTAYRGTALAKEDLWRALESHDTATDVRAGAARILLRVAPEKEQDRIARALDSIHDDVTRRHIRAALEEDVEAAAREYENVVRPPAPRRSG